ncbi:uncharacterized protein LOC117177392 [Belonocnema kinseyi]|uniref:uncharacterized protein LOC117177392 n=1 Tax=Belonocnema kinseyi TaxID=2817044 RepID=UPI00143D1801|nr:uncharacterized protein LOC117177392 [Belonocnema kinseyi]
MKFALGSFFLTTIVSFNSIELSSEMKFPFCSSTKCLPLDDQENPPRPRPRNNRLSGFAMYRVFMRTFGQNRRRFVARRNAHEIQQQNQQNVQHNQEQQNNQRQEDQ